MAPRRHFVVVVVCGWPIYCDLLIFVSVACPINVILLTWNRFEIVSIFSIIAEKLEACGVGKLAGSATARWHCFRFVSGLLPVCFRCVVPVHVEGVEGQVVDASQWASVASGGGGCCRRRRRRMLFGGVIRRAEGRRARKRFRRRHRFRRKRRFRSRSQHFYLCKFYANFMQIFGWID